jgi:hypothetical protein
MGRTPHLCDVRIGYGRAFGVNVSWPSTEDRTHAMPNRIASATQGIDFAYGLWPRVER